MLKIIRRLSHRAAGGDSTLHEQLAVLRSGPRFTPLTCKLGNIRLSVADGPSAASQYEYIFQKHSYDFPTHDPEPVILDCGANIGLGVLYWKQHHARAKIIAFEADPYIADFLGRNCESWGLSDVTLVNKALWSSEGFISFRSNRADGGHISNGPSSEEMVRVACTPLSSYLNTKVALLKMDIEGAELEVMEECKDKLGNVERVFVEYHSFVDETQKLSRLLEILADAGFRYYIHPELESPTPFKQIEVHNGKDLRVNIFGVRV